MTMTMITHRLIRAVRRDAATEVMHKAGVLELVTRTSYERTCLCGRVFRGDTELQAIGYFLQHLPKPKAPTEGAPND